jgi:hypothetical protein
LAGRIAAIIVVLLASPWIGRQMAPQEDECEVVQCVIVFIVAEPMGVRGLGGLT